jgi:L-asparagine transporter-like permease
MKWWISKLLWLPSLCFIGFVTLTNLLGVKYYGELEFVLSFVSPASPSSLPSSFEC